MPTLAAIWRQLRWAIALGLVAALLYFARPAELFALLRGLPPRYLIALAALCAGWLLLGAANVFLLLRAGTLSFRRFLPHYLSGWAASSLLPGQLGDATLVLWLRQEGVPMRRSSAAYLVDKAVSFAWLVLVAAIGVALVLPGTGWWAPPLATATLALALFLVSRPELRGWTLSRLAARGIDLEKLLSELGQLRARPRLLALNAAITIGKWGVTSLLYWIAFHGVGAAQPLRAVATLPFASSLVGYLPITVGGLGTTEWSAVALFARYGADSTAVVAVYVVLRGVLLTLVGAGLALTYLSRLRGRRAAA